MKPPAFADRTLEDDLQHAFVAARYETLLRFAAWCAAQVEISPRSPQSWRDLRDLVQDRAAGRCDQGRFAPARDALLDTMPVMSAGIGLKFGDPSAATLLTLCAAAGDAPLSAALAASSNLLLHVELRAQRQLAPPVAEAQGAAAGGARAAPRAIVVDAARSVATVHGAAPLPPPVAAALLACRVAQRAAWRRRMAGDEPANPTPSS